MKLCFVASIPMSIKVFLGPHIVRLSEFHEVTIVANGSPREFAGLLGPRISFVAVPIERDISLVRDLRALFALWLLFHRERFDTVHSITPKAGLLSMVAARLAGVPRRIHTFSGQVWATTRGVRRAVFKAIDRFLAWNATRLFADGPSQRVYLIENGIVDADRISVVAEGSFAGVDLDRFRFDAESRRCIRAEHDIPDAAVVFMFLGRLHRDKGLADLARAFESAAGRDDRVQLLIVGPDEHGLEPIFTAMGVKFPGRVHRAGFTDSPEKYLSASDVLCLPSYREGFPVAPLQASAVGIPVIASRIYGVTDSVAEGISGILHQPKANDEIAEAMLLLASNKPLRDRMGAAGRSRIAERFSEDRVATAFAQCYAELLSTPTGRPPLTPCNQK